MENKKSDESYFKRGLMTKDPFTMTPEELEVWDEKVKRETREYLFSIGQPLVNIINGQVIIEYADGTIEKR